MSKQVKESSEGSDNSKEMPCIPEGTKPLDKQCLSKELATLLKVKTTNKMTRGQVIKNIWSYINEHNLQDPNDTAYIIPDEKMAAVFGKERFVGFSMATYLEKHYNSKDPSAFDTECKSEGLGPLDKQCLSHELTSLLNVDEDIKMTRDQVVKRVWNYIDEHDLKESKNARYIIPDEKMSTVFGEEKFLGFSMTKYLESHYKKENVSDNTGEETSNALEGSYNMGEDFVQTVDKNINEIGADIKEGLDLASKELDKFEKIVEENMDVTEADLKEGINIAGEELAKIGQLVEEKIDVAEIDVKEGFDRVGKKIEQFGQIVEEKIDVTEENIKEGLDHAGNELDKFGQKVEEKMDVVDADIKEVFGRAGEELEKFGQNIEEKMEEAKANIKEGLNHAHEELKKLAQNVQEKFEKE